MSIAIGFIGGGDGGGGGGAASKVVSGGVRVEILSVDGSLMGLYSWASYWASYALVWAFIGPLNLGFTCNYLGLLLGLIGLWCMLVLSFIKLCFKILKIKHKNLIKYNLN